MNDTPINTVKIAKDTQYKVSVIVSEEVDDLCSAHNFIVNGKLSLICNAGTAEPTQTNVPTMPTVSPTLSPTFESHLCMDSSTDAWDVWERCYFIGSTNVQKLPSALSL